MRTSLAYLILGSLLFSLQSFASSQPIDAMEQRLAACTQCHGEYGFGNPNDAHIPRLAEKPAGYLFKQLMLFKSGDRKSDAMNYVVRHLSSDYLQQMAEYYAKQRVPFTKNPIPAITEEQLKRAEQLVYQGDASRAVPACTQCHGQALTGVKPMIPGILNQPFDYTLTQMKMWRSNARPVSSTYCMWVVANRIAEADVEAVSAWLAVQPLPENRDPVALVDLPEKLPEWCTLEASEVQ